MHQYFFLQPYYYALGPGPKRGGMYTSLAPSAVLLRQRSASPAGGDPLAAVPEDDICMKVD